MFSTSGLRLVRVADIPQGNLVLGTIGGKRQVGMLAASPIHHSNQVGILYFLSASPGVTNSAPEFDPGSLNGFAIDLGCKPEFAWSGRLDVFAATRDEAPTPGHLAIIGGTIALSGRIHAGPSNVFPSYWNVSDGSVMPEFELGRAVYLKSWQVGWRDAENALHALVKFPTTLAELLDEAAK